MAPVGEFWEVPKLVSVSRTLTCSLLGAVKGPAGLCPEWGEAECWMGGRGEYSAHRGEKGPS